MCSSDLCMNEDRKKFYWIKLRQDFFQREVIDWLQDQENGYAYIVLYLKLCLLTANSGGELIRMVGDMTVPYDPKKIAQKTGIDYDTVTIALSLFKHLGLVVENADGISSLPEVAKMVGEESASREAIKKRSQRQKKKLQGTKEGTKCPQLEGTTCKENSSQSGTDCPIEYRAKSIEIKSTDIRAKENREERKEEKPAAAGADQKDALTEVVRMYQNNIHPITGEIERDRLIDLYTEYGPDWLTEAIREAAIHRAGSIAYVQAILRRWQSTGQARPWDKDRAPKRKAATGKIGRAHV